MTFSAKNLYYEKQEPAFLRQLRAENTTDRQNVSVARPRKPRLEIGDDGPTIVDEQGENVTEQEYQDLVRGTRQAASGLEFGSTAANELPKSDVQGSLPDTTDDKDKERAALHASASNGPKKRKQVKAVAAESRPVPQTELLPARCEPSNTKVDADTTVKRRSKKKKIKLSFDDPET